MENNSKITNHKTSGLGIFTEFGGMGIVTVSLCWIILVVYLLFKHYENAHFLRLLPTEIQTSGTVLVSGEFAFRGGCGAAIFKLADATRIEIERAGLNFFDSATQPKSTPNTPHGHSDWPRSYKKWERTPVPASWTSEGVWPGLGCANLNHLYATKIVKNSVAEGSYFTTNQQGSQLVVIPELGIVVFSYFD